MLPVLLATYVRDSLFPANPGSVTYGPAAECRVFSDRDDAVGEEDGAENSRRVKVSQDSVARNGGLGPVARAGNGESHSPEPRGPVVRGGADHRGIGVEVDGKNDTFVAF